MKLPRVSLCRNAPHEDGKGHAEVSARSVDDRRPGLLLRQGFASFEAVGRVECAERIGVEEAFADSLRPGAHLVGVEGLGSVRFYKHIHVNDV